MCERAWWCGTVNRAIYRVVRYRFRATFGVRSGGYFSVLVLLGLVAGLAMGSVAGARRTQSSFSTFLASSNPSDLLMASARVNISQEFFYEPSLVRVISHLPHVKRAETYVGFNNVLTLAGPNGSPGVPRGMRVPTAAEQIGFIGSLNGEFFTQDRVAVLKGRMANPASADEIVMSKLSAETIGAQVGDSVPLGFYTDAQAALPGFGAASTVKPSLRIVVKLVGIVVSTDAVVQDDLDRFPTFVLLTPALTEHLVRLGCGGYAETGLHLVGGSAEVPAVEAEATRALGTPPTVESTSDFAAKADRALRPDSIALGVFGGIVGLAALLIALQLIARQLGRTEEDLAIMRALGADRRMRFGDGLLGTLGTVFLGSLLAGVIAVGLSPIFPIGSVRPVDPAPGVAFDWTVLGLGTAVLAGALGLAAVAIAYRTTNPRPAGSRPWALHPGSSTVRLAATAGFPPSTVEGIRFALESGPSARSVPVRSNILGVAFALAVVVSTITFGASLTSLVSHPPEYGWNWNYELDSNYGGQAGIPHQMAETLLKGDSDVAAWTAVFFGKVSIDGQEVAVLGETPKAGVAPPVLSGHSLVSENQVVLGAATLAQLHKRVGDSVMVNGGAGSTTLRVVGTATLPTVGASGQLHTTMGTGAVLAYQVIAGADRPGPNGTGVDPDAIFVRFRRGADLASALRRLEGVASALGQGPTSDGPVSVVSVQRPAEIVNYRSSGSTPELLGAGLALGATAALGLTLMASVRRRRHDLALLKTLGLTHRQLRAVVAWQSSVVVGIGAVFGVPLGVVMGGYLWGLFAKEIYVVPNVSIPGWSICLVVGISLLLASVVAAVPGRIASRTSTAYVLRSE